MKRAPQLGGFRNTSTSFHSGNYITTSGPATDQGYDAYAHGSDNPPIPEEIFNQDCLPDFPNINSFAQPVIHGSHWPAAQFDGFTATNLVDVRSYQPIPAIFNALTTPFYYHDQGQQLVYPSLNKFESPAAINCQSYFPATTNASAPVPAADLACYTSTNHFENSVAPNLFHGHQERGEMSWDEALGTETVGASSTMSTAQAPASFGSAMQRNENSCRRPACSICKKTFSRKSDLQRHTKKHNLEARKHFCWVEECACGGSYRRDKVRSHVRNCHPEFVDDGELVLWDHCRFEFCEYGGYCTKEMWITHWTDCHPESVEDGNLVSKKHCAVLSCNHNRRYNRAAWAAHYREYHSLVTEFAEPVVWKCCCYDHLNLRNYPIYTNEQWVAHCKAHHPGWTPAM